MGMFDTIMVYMECPLCGKSSTIDAQTKDLDCCLHTYYPLDEDWETGTWGKEMRKGLSVFPQFPLDKSAAVWADQAERIEAKATIGEDYQGQLNFVTVIAECKKCNKYFDGKVAIKGNKLVGKIYDIVEDK